MIGYVNTQCKIKHSGFVPREDDVSCMFVTHGWLFLSRPPISLNYLVSQNSQILFKNNYRDFK